MLTLGMVGRIFASGGNNLRGICRASAMALGASGRAAFCDLLAVDLTAWRHAGRAAIGEEDLECLTGEGGAGPAIQCSHRRVVGIGPKDELEGMMAAQLLAAHSATMECYRRAKIGEQTFEGRRENLSQANKLSRTYAVLLDALNRHRGKGTQKITVEHV